MRPTAREHDLCLRAAWRIREEIANGQCTEQEASPDLTALNVVAGAYACNEPVQSRFWHRAREIAGF